MTVITRFAPSPTGKLHVGNLRTALINWLYARKAGGRFILRIDDTDQERSREDYVDAIKRDLEWLGLTWDADARQSDRMDRYRAAAEDLRASGRLYGCYDTPADLDLKRKKLLNMGRPPVYDRTGLHLSDEARTALETEGRSPHWRFLLDQERVEWTDMVRGDVSIDCASVSDPVLIREDGQFLYTLCSVCDDMDMGVTHVIRGEDHVTNTATQVQIFRALGGEPTSFAHLALLVGAGGEGLSKRLGSLSIEELRDGGAEPMAILSLLARLGSSDPVEPRLDHAALIDGFDIARYGRAPARFDPADLDPLNAAILRETPFESVADRMQALGFGAEAGAAWAVLRENITRLDDLSDWRAILAGEAAPVIADEDQAFVTEAMALLPARPWTDSTWKDWTGAVKTATGRKGKALFMPLRRALTGRDQGPDMSRLMPLIRANCV